MLSGSEAEYEPYDEISDLPIQQHGLLLPNDSYTQSRYHGRSRATSPANVEHLPLQAVLLNPHVKRLYDDLQEASKQVVKSNNFIQKVVEENQRLAKDLQVLRSQGIQSPRLRAISQYHLDSRSTSLAPSDSISQSPINSDHASTSTSNIPIIPLLRPSTLPHNYPFEVLWNLSDCRDDPDVEANSNNPSRPSMKVALREADGSMIHPQKYTNIKSDVSALCSSNLHDLPSPSGYRRNTSNMKPPSRSMSWYKTNHRTKWNSVVAELERMHSVLRLCAGSWKAEHMLSQHLNSLISQAKKGGLERGKAASSGNAEPGDDHQPNGTNPATSSPKPSSTVASLPPIQPTSALVPVPSSASKRTRSDSSEAVGNPELVSKKSRPAPEPPHLSNDDEETHESLDNVFGLQKRPGTSITANTGPIPAGSNGTGGSSGTATIALPTSTLNIANIVVSPSYTNLRECLVEEYASIKMAGPLMDRLNLLSATYSDQDPSENVTALILRIEAADPNCETVSENDTNAGWGHYQFTAGSLTLSTVLTTWKDVGNVPMAFRLLAASIKTCRVARHICFQRGLRPLSYLSDIYLDRAVDTLWDLVKDLQLDAENPSAPGSDSGGTAGNLEKSLHGLTVGILKAYMQSHGPIICSVASPKKVDLIAAILSSEHAPSAEEINKLTPERRTAKGKKTMTS